MPDLLWQYIELTEGEMFEMMEKVKYIGHHDGCSDCAMIPPVDDPWANRRGKLGTYIGTPGRYENTVKVHFDGEDGPVYVYNSHLEKA